VRSSVEKLTLTNFRKFEKFSLKLRSGNVLVGPNNCGKSSILDAFRLLEACFRYTRSKTPTLLQIDGEGIVYGYEIPEKSLPFGIANATHNYSNNDAIVEATLGNGTCGVIRIHPEHQTRFYLRVDGRQPTSSSSFRAAFPISLILVPTLAPLEAEEPYVEDETVQKNSNNRLASRVLRNIWLRRPEEEFDSFRADIESAWPTIQLKKPELVRHNLMASPIVQMYYSENRMDREVQWAGFGFQVWLQIQTHLRRGGMNSTLVIDEPDIYLHPDLQRRLLKDAQSKFGQFVMATHAVEIVNEADAHEVVSVNSEYRTGKRLKTDGDYAALFQYLGSTENVDFARVARAKKVIFVEGKDGRLLRKIAAKFELKNLAVPHQAPIVQLGGVTEWRRASHAVWAFRKVLDLEVKAFCIFDRDYRDDAEVDKFLALAEERDFECRILDAKEIENYILAPSAILAATRARLKARKSDEEIGLEDVLVHLRGITDGLKTLVFSRRLAEALRFAEESGSPIAKTTLIENLTCQFEKAWESQPRRLRLCPGKELFSRLNEKLQEELKISLTETNLVSHLDQADISPFFLKLLKDLDNFSKP
jgi:hypothetical protein